MKNWSLFRTVLIAIPALQVVLIGIFTDLLAQRVSPILLFAVFFIVTLIAFVWLWNQINVLKKMGISRLDSSMSTGFNVRDCINKTNSSLSFLGISGMKWRREAKAMDEMFDLLSWQKGRVRFLLLDPDCEEARKFTSSRKMNHKEFRKDVKATIEYFRQKKKQRGINIEVKLYNSFPAWRITMVDDSYLVLGAYFFESIDGTETPQLIFEGKSEWSFARCIKSTFENEWNRAKDAFSAFPTDNR
jgi:hypothetical protein